MGHGTTGTDVVPGVKDAEFGQRVESGPVYFRVDGPRDRHDSPHVVSGDGPRVESDQHGGTLQASHDGRPFRVQEGQGGVASAFAFGLPVGER